MRKPVIKRGKFIVIDGTDGSGKGTQTELLIKQLREQGRNVELADFPRYGMRSAAMVEDYLNGEYGTSEEVGPYRASILFACDRYAASKQIETWLTEGKIVVANRYNSANMGHQAGKILDLLERDRFLDWITDLEFNIFQIPKPDLTLLLYLDPLTSQSRVDKKSARAYLKGKKRDIHEDDLNHLKHAADAFLYVANRYKWPVIDASNDIESVAKKVWSEVSKHIE